MTRLLLILFLLLTACGESPPSDLRRVESAARSTLDSAAAGVKATQDAVQQERTRATLQAAKTQGAAQIEIDLLQARIEATLQARDLEIASARATEESRPVHATQTQAVIDSATIRRPTETARALVVAHDLDMLQRSQTLDLFWLYFWPVFGVALLLSLLVLAIRLGLNLYEYAIKWRTLSNSVRGPGGSRFAWQVNGETFQAVPGTRPLPLHVPDPVHRLGNGDVAYVSGMPPRKQLPAQRSESHLVARLLSDAIEIAGEDSTMLPGWRVLQDRGWTSDAWQRATAPLIQAGAVIAQVRVGTYVADNYVDLAGLLDAIETRKLRVIPTPPLDFQGDQ